MMCTSRFDDIAFGAMSRVLDVERFENRIGGRDDASVREHSGPIGSQDSNDNENGKQQMKHSPARIKAQPRPHNEPHNGDGRHDNEHRHRARHTTRFRLFLRAQPTAPIVGARTTPRALFASFATTLVALHALACRTSVLRQTTWQQFHY